MSVFHFLSSGIPDLALEILNLIIRVEHRVSDEYVNK